MDLDIYVMTLCKHFIITRSTFGFIPALLHKNIVYSYDDWIHYKDLIQPKETCNKIQLLENII